MKIIILWFGLIFSIKGELWFSKIKSYNMGDFKTGYAGDNVQNMTDFYLCGKRHYRVHFLGDDETNWSREFTNCEPVGDGRKIDAIAIDGGLEYVVSVNGIDTFQPIVKGYDITDPNNGFSGKIGTPIDAISVQGGEIYRFGFLENSSNPVSVAKRIIEMLFNIKKTNSELEEEIEIVNNNKFRATSRILSNHEINFEVNNNMLRLVFNFYTRKNYEYLVDDDFGGEIDDDLNEIIETKFGFKDDLKLKFKDLIHCGWVSIYFFWDERKIQIEIATRIYQDIDNLRGGNRIIIDLKNDDVKLLNKIKEIVLLMSRYTDINGRNNIKIIMESFTDIAKLSEVEKNIPMYRGVMNRIILSLILFSS